MQYLQLGLETKNEIAQNTLQFISSELVSIEDSLNRVESVLQRFRTENKIVNLSSEGKEVYERLSQLEQQYSLQKTKARYYNYLDTYLSKDREIDAIVAPSAMGVEDPVLIEIIGNLTELYVQRKSMNAGMTNINPRARELDARIESARSVLEESLDNLQESTSIAMEQIEERIDKLERELSRFPKTERELLNIRRKFELNENLYVFLMQKKAETGIALASNTADNRIIDEAIVSETPVKPKPGRNYAIGLVLGLLLPAGFLFGRDFFDNKVRSKEDVEKVTQVPVVGMIGHSEKASNLVLVEHPKSGLAESFRALRANLNFLEKDDQKIKTIMITSSIGGEGKTFNSINLACALASGKKKTVLVGVDLRKPKIYHDFGLQNKVGVSSYLTGHSSLSEVVQPTKVSHLDMISAGPIPPNPSELILSKKFEK
ncbi:MAG: GNVR domain-containing protein [Owenweeksia sp.]|nr:GNVR domain-containing protein [Owenweeksia sp.]